ncbi:MAG: DinB family protein [Phycisphaerales bacterium]|nr:DinB family protein [Phycisphaerales bacterium]
MGHTANMIVSGLRMSVRMAEMQLKEVKPEQFARKVSIGGRVIDSNHPAFVYGHLSTYPFGAGQAAGFVVPPVPAGFADLFPAGKECRDDPERTIYPAMDVITKYFFEAHRAAEAGLVALSDEKLAGPNPREGRMKEMFPTLGGLLMFYLTSHPMLHLGQVSAWRRGMGLGPVM